MDSGVEERVGEPSPVGREAEVAAVTVAVERAPMLVLVAGEAGSGKTRLIQELTARPRTYVGRCPSLREPPPLGPVVDALRTASLATRRLDPVTGALRPWLPELAAVLPEDPEPVTDVGIVRHRVFRAVHELLGALGRATVILEDLHRADPLTLELLQFLASRLPANLALVCTWRPEDLPAQSTLPHLSAQLPPGVASLQIALNPLGNGAMRELAASVLGVDAITDDLSSNLAELTGGVPLAVIELLQAVERESVVDARGIRLRRALDETALPIRIGDPVLERLRRLSSDAQEVVKAAAVFEDAVDEATLIRVAGFRERRAAAAIVEALATSLLVEAPEGRYGFRHALARRAVETEIPSPERRRLHGRAASALEKADAASAAVLARHFRLARRTAKWLRYTEAAADQAGSPEDHVVVYRLLRDAVRCTELPAVKRGHLAVRLALHGSRCYEHEDAIAAVRPLLADKALPQAVRGELRLRLGVLLHAAGDLGGGYAELERAIGELSHRPAIAARAMAMLAAPSFTEGLVDEHLHWLDRAVATARRSRDRVTRIAVAADRAAIQLGLGDPEGWRSLAAVPLPGSDPEELRQAARCSANVSDALIHLGHYDRAQKEIRHGLKLAKTAPDARGMPALAVGQLELDWLTGRWERLEERARTSAEAWRGWPGLEADARVVLGLLLLARGDVRDAAVVFDAYRDDFPGEAPMRSWIAAALTRMRLAEAGAAAAAGEARRGLELVRRKGIWVWAAEIAPPAVVSLVAADSRDEAVLLVRDFERGLRGRDAPAASAAVLMCHAVLAETATAYLEAERAWRALSRPYEAAHALERAGTCLLPDDLVRGRQHLVAALDVYRRLGAEWDAAQVTRTLRKHGLIPPHRRGRKGYGGGLTPRESEVVRLAVDGLTNREIAVALVLSRKTVEHYLGSAMRKLGVASRTELPADATIGSTAEKWGVPTP